VKRLLLTLLPVMGVLLSVFLLARTNTAEAARGVDESGLGSGPIDPKCPLLDSGSYVYCEPFTQGVGGQPNSNIWESASSGVSLYNFLGSYNYGCDLATNNIVAPQNGGGGFFQQTMTQNTLDAACLSDYTYLDSGIDAAVAQIPPATWYPGATGLQIPPFYIADLFSMVPIPPGASASSTTVIETVIQLAPGANSDTSFALLGAHATPGQGIYALSRTGANINETELDLPENNSSPNSGCDYAYFNATGSIVYFSDFTCSPDPTANSITIDLVWVGATSLAFYINRSLIINMTSQIPNVPLYAWYEVRPSCSGTPCVAVNGSTVNVSNKVSVLRVCQNQAAGHITCP
jgi:hypothetical protein